MKVEEIQIGDWVQNPLGWRAQVRGIRRIQAITDEFEWRVKIGLNDDTFTDLSLGEIKPIQLTTEILEKNGFRKLVTYGTEKWLCNNFRLNVYNSEGTWRFCADTNRNEDSVIYIRFVHELQNALQLCGIEKTIEL